MVWNTTQKIKPCSKECKKIQTKQYYLDKYGVDHPMKSKEVQQRHKKAMIEKYGVEHALQSEKLKRKASNTIKDKYGTDWALSNIEIRNKAKATMQERYGGQTTLQSPALKNKVKQTVINRYGVDNIQKNIEIKNKTVKTNLGRYGATNPMKNKEIAQKSKINRYQNIDKIQKTIEASFLQKYGYRNCFQSPVIKDKIKQTLMDKYGESHPMRIPEIRNKVYETMIQKYGTPYFPNAEYSRSSKINSKFGDYLTSLGVSFEVEFRINYKFFDFRYAENNILVEINPSYTHNVFGNHWKSEGLPWDYHINKTKLAERHGYRCIHVWDWDDWDRLKSILIPITHKIHARKCKIYKLHKYVGDKFLSDYHLQGSCRGQLLYLGLVYGETLLQVMTFGKSRYNKNYDIELMRMGTLPGYSVIGGASKLFNFATKGYGLNNIITYCDRSKFTGDVYEKMGMKYLHTTPPQEIWSKEDKYISSNLLWRYGYDKLFRVEKEDGKTNIQYMIGDGWLPMFDCGKDVYVYRSSND